MWRRRERSRANRHARADALADATESRALDASTGANAPIRGAGLSGHAVSTFKHFLSIISFQ